jgi:hypothetical protein
MLVCRIVSYEKIFVENIFHLLVYLILLMKRDLNGVIIEISKSSLKMTPKNKF